MSDPFIGEIKLFSFSFAPKGWAFCNGQLLPTNQNQALFSLLGTTYGGDGKVNFALPNLQGSTPIHRSNNFTQGNRGGEQSHTLSVSEIPAHSHNIHASSLAASTPDPRNAYWAQADLPAYSASANGSMAAQAVANTGGSQAHQNQPPYLALNFCIALQGIFPSST